MRPVLLCTLDEDARDSAQRHHDTVVLFHHLTKRARDDKVVLERGIRPHGAEHLAYSRVWDELLDRTGELRDVERLYYNLDFFVRTGKHTPKLVLVLVDNLGKLVQEDGIEHPRSDYDPAVSVPRRVQVLEIATVVCIVLVPERSVDRLDEFFRRKRPRVANFV